jgi:hypothetical protein
VPGKLCRRIDRHRKEQVVFVGDPTVPATNNAAERSVRHLVTRRKISGGTQSTLGTTSKMTLALLFGTGRVRGLTPSISVVSSSNPLTSERLRAPATAGQLGPQGPIIPLVLAPVRLHCSAEVAVYAAYRPGSCQLSWLLVHCSRLSFIEVWFAILGKECLDRSEWADLDAAAQHILASIATCNSH